MPYWSKIARQLAQIVDDKLERLRVTGYDELAAMPRGREDVEIMGRRGVIGICVEHPDDSTVRIILQGSVPVRWPFPGSHWHVVGLQKTRDGVCRELDGIELSEYD